MTRVEPKATWTEEAKPRTPVEVLERPNDLIQPSLQTDVVATWDRVFQIEHHEVRRALRARRVDVLSHGGRRREMRHLDEVLARETEVARVILGEEGLVPRKGALGERHRTRGPRRAGL